jgi:hypothetical protein
MYTSILLVALTGVAPSAEAGKVPSWSLDYTAASKQAASADKPLAVFLAPGSGAYEKISQGGLSDEARKVLADRYVCVHIDTTTTRGQELARAFQMPEGLGLVISDRSGDRQAFRHEGDLADADLVRYLERYSDPNHVFQSTETNPSRRGTSSAGYQYGSYPSGGYTYGASPAGGYAYGAYPSGGGCGGGMCMTCGGGGGCGSCGGGRHHGHRGHRCR